VATVFPNIGHFDTADPGRDLERIADHPGGGSRRT
jgi:hypothetical protein